MIGRSLAVYESRPRGGRSKDRREAGGLAITGVYARGAVMPVRIVDSCDALDAPLRSGYVRVMADARPPSDDEAPPLHEDEYPDAVPHGAVRGRGAGLNPANRYEGYRLHVLGEELDRLAEQTEGEGPRQVKTVVYRDRSRSIINRVDPNSADIGFNWTLNPYRGCEHGCIYCYARPDHERLGMSCGLDFETKIVAKPEAPAMLERALAKASWQGEPIVMAGVTDPYQPIERKLRITRGCLEVMARCKQPVSFVTKNRLVTRDLDLLRELAAHRVVRVAVSITTLDAALAGEMEPRAASPQHRLETVRLLTEAGVPAMVMVAPIVPGLTDHETPAILEAAAEAGAVGASYVLLRLPHQIKALFLDWLKRTRPQRADHVESLIRQTRGGELYDARFGIRQKGEGPLAAQIGQQFKVFAKRYGLARKLPALNSDAFVRPSLDGQMGLFG
jgi:DNA repair photolyase